MQNSASLQREERRQFHRRGQDKTVYYCLNGNESSELKSFDLNGSLIDLSERGVCLQTDNPLSEGHIIYFDDNMDQQAGVVRWCSDMERFYRAGIELNTETAYAKNAEMGISGWSAFISEDVKEYNKTLDSATGRFIKEMEILERRCDDPKEDPEALFKAIEQAAEEMINVCAEYENRIQDMDVIREARAMFREKTKNIFSKSYCINRARVWPQGSQGDYKTLETIYKNTPLSEGFGYYLDRLMMNTQLGYAVRDRIKKLENILREEFIKRQAPAVLNIACGACRELVGVVPEIIDSGAKVVCLDSDNDALEFAQGRLHNMGLREGVEFYKYNALRLFDYEMALEEFGEQDVVYSVGFFDYLPSDFLVKLLGTLYRMLKTDGLLIAAFKDAAKYRSQYYHWLVDWDGFLQRKEEDFKKILHDAGIPFSSIKEMRDETGIIIFYKITKQ